MSQAAVLTNIYSKNILLSSKPVHADPGDEGIDTNGFCYKVDTRNCYVQSYHSWGDEVETPDNMTCAGIINGTYSNLVGTEITIDWGDGTKTTVSDGVFNDTICTHTYEYPGIYNVQISSTGNFPQIGFYVANGNDRYSYIDEDQTYYQATVTKILTSIPICYDTSGNKITSFDYTFYYCRSLEEIPENLFCNYMILLHLNTPLVIAE